MMLAVLSRMFATISVPDVAAGVLGEESSARTTAMSCIGAPV